MRVVRGPAAAQAELMVQCPSKKTPGTFGGQVSSRLTGAPGTPTLVKSLYMSQQPHPASKPEGKESNNSLSALQTFSNCLPRPEHSFPQTLNPNPHPKPRNSPIKDPAQDAFNTFFSETGAGKHVPRCVMAARLSAYWVKAFLGA